MADVKESREPKTPYRTAYEANLSIKTVRHYLRTAGTWQERKIWAEMLNGPEYNKFKNGVKLEKRRKHQEEVAAPTPKKKK